MINFQISRLSLWQEKHVHKRKQSFGIINERCANIYGRLADEWAQGRRFYNLLGATEVFLFSAHAHTTGGQLSIGRPLPNTSCYILDEDDELVPMGRKGTLWVGGAGVAKGYINLPLTTDEKFRRDKFANDG
jgi:non-ribosomal peptide synthetase component F